MFLRVPGCCEIHDFYVKSINYEEIMIYNIFIISGEKCGFVEIQSGDTKKLQKHMERHWFYKAWHIRDAPD